MAYQKGQSGNPSGRPKIVLASGKTLTKLAREYTEDAVECLVEIIRDKDAPHAARASASLGLLDRGWGRPAQSLTLMGDAANPIQHALSYDHMSDEQLRVLSSIRIVGPIDAE